MDYSEFVFFCCWWLLKSKILCGGGLPKILSSNIAGRCEVPELAMEISMEQNTELNREFSSKPSLITEAQVRNVDNVVCQSLNTMFYIVFGRTTT